MEAMAFGLPIIGVDALGIPELVDDKENGFLATPDNHRQIAKFAVKLIENPELAKKMGQKSRQKIKQFSLSKTVNKLENVYLELRPASRGEPASTRGEPASTRGES